MHRRLRLVGLIVLFTLALLPHGSAPAAGSPRGSGHIVGHEVLQPRPAFSGGQLTTESGAAAPADAGSTGGETLLYTSPSIDATQLFDRIGVHWIAERGTEDSFFVELRTSADGSSWDDWSLLAEEEDMADALRNEHYAAPRPSVDGAHFAQYRVWLTGGDANVLVQVGVTFMDVSDLNAGPLARLMNDVEGAFRDFGESYASAAAVGVSKVRTRQDWGADESLMRWTPEYRKVQKAVVHHTVTDDGGTNPANTIRGIYYFHAVTRGWGDIGYQYLADKYGNIWIGRAGGDNVIGGHAYGWNNGSFGVAAIGNYSVTVPTAALQGAIANIIAIKFAQFGIQPYGADPFTHQEQRTDGSWINVSSSPPNIQGHRDCNYIVGQNGGQTECPGNGLYQALPTIRSMAQNAVQNGYTQLVRLEPLLPKAGIGGASFPVATAVYNLGTTTIPAGTNVSYQVLQKGTVVVGQGGQVPLPVPVPPGGSAVVSVPFSVPTTGSYTVRWDLQTGSAWWNALYNDPFRDMWFRATEWSVDWVSDTVPRSWFAGQTSVVTATVTNDGGRAWPATGVNPVVLGYRWIDDATGAVTIGNNFSNLPTDVQTGQGLTLAIAVTAPLTSANYTLELDLYKQNEFWFKDKGIPPDPTPIGVGLDFHASYLVGAVPPIGLGQTVIVPVTVTNTGQGIFPTQIANLVDLGYHWYDSAGRIAVWDGLRTRLPNDLASGQSAVVQAQVQSPPNGGSYTLRVDLVQEGVAWFSTRGVPTGTASATVCCAKTYGATYQPQIATLAASGAQQAIPITLTNTGSFTWAAGGANPVDLSYHWASSTGATVVWDGLRTKLPADVAPGQSITVQASIRFPSTAGDYRLRWDLVEEGVSWFSGRGVPTLDQPVRVSAYVAPFYGGSLAATQTPAAMATRMTTTVGLRVQNLSSFAWDGTVNLSYHWYDAAGNVVTWDGARTSLAGLRIGEVRAVAAPVIGPASPGQYTLRWDIVQEGVTWFSSQGMQLPANAVRIDVPERGAVYELAASTSGAAGATISVPVTVTNTGSLTWQGGLVNLSYHVLTPSGAVVVWDGVRTALPGLVAPGQIVPVAAQVTLPAAPGSYVVKFDVVQEGFSWFSAQGVPPASATLLVQ
ncbi:MAG TPA: N-acetylmuramoyl-L-alanine amidase [Candidatus Limnocylindria bacterium]